MRRAFLIGGLAMFAGLMAGCGGGGGGHSPFNASSKIVVGYVYVATNNVPAGTPDIVIAGSATAPNGYAAPTAGVLTLHVDNGTITRSSADEPFDMAVDGNAVVARVTSLSTGTPSLSYSGNGFQFNGVPKSNIPTQVMNMVGADDITLVLSYQSPSYTPGAPAAIKVLVRDPNGADKFGAPGDVIPTIIPSLSAVDNYDIAVVALDANNVVIPGTTPTITDPNSNATETAVTEGGGQIAVAGGGVEGVGVPMTFGVNIAPALTSSFTPIYTYGATNTFTATFAPVGPIGLIWPAAGPAASQGYAATLRNIHSVPVPNRAIAFTRADTATAGNGAAAVDPYPGPAAGSAFSGASATTDAAGQGVVTFQTPTGAAGNPTFNGLNIKGTDKLQIRVTNASGPVAGFTNVVISRPLASIAISGPSRLDVGTQSTLIGSQSYQILNGVDIDGLSVGIPAGAPSWTAANTAGVGNVGDLDDATAQSTSVASVNGSGVVTAGATAGQVKVSVTISGTTSNQITTQIIGVPSKIVFTPASLIDGYHGTTGQVDQLDFSLIDSWGHLINGSEWPGFSKSGSISSSAAGNLTFPAAPSVHYTLTFGAASGGTFTVGVNGTWVGTVGGTSPFNLNRTTAMHNP